MNKTAPDTPAAPSGAAAPSPAGTAIQSQAPDLAFPPTILPESPPDKPPPAVAASGNPVGRPATQSLTGGQLYPDRIVKTRRRVWHLRKSKYHHGSLVDSALKRGLEIVAKSGPMALTLRGLARDLNVTASALVHFFGNRAGMRAAVAEAAAEQMKPFSVVRCGGLRAGATLRATAESWVDYAAQNPNLYRLIFGEGWRDGRYPTLTRRQSLFSYDRIANIGQMSGHIRKGDTMEHARLLFAAAHGMAMFAADGGLPHRSHAPLVNRFVSMVENPARTAPR